MMWHGYVRATEDDLDTLRGLVADADAPQPCHRLHWAKADGAVIAEARFREIPKVGAILGDDWRTGGRVARGCVGATVHTVTTLKDGGSGSLRRALEAMGRRAVVFGVAGDIVLNRPIAIRNDGLTVLGQTAPAGGVCVRGSYIQVEAGNVTLQHLRLRPRMSDALQINAPAHHVLIDHCSLSWAVDENLDLYGNGTPNSMHDIEVRHSIISECLNDAGHEKGPHSMGAIVGGGTDRVLFDKCLFAHNNQRNPLIKCGRADIVNCVMYNGGILFHASGEPRFGQTQVNLINNYQAFSLDDARAKLRNYLWWYEVDGEIGEVMVYEAGTVIDGYDGPALRLLNGYDGTVDEHLVGAPFAPLYVGEPMSAAGALVDVLANAGATLPRRDVVDARIVDDVRNGTGGLIDDPAEVGGWPDLTVVSKAWDGYL